MALLRRYAGYTALAALFLYMFYSLSFPYDNGQTVGNTDDNNEHRQPDRPKEAPPPTRYNWADVKLLNPVESLIPLPTGAPQPLPKIQHNFGDEEAAAKNIRESRREEVRKTFFRCWKNYRAKAWMHDELKPITGGTRDTFGGWAATLIDSLDTLWIMGFKEEFLSAMKDVEKIDFGTTRLEEVNVFETTIRHLGGLLSAYELSKEEVLLTKAKEVGEMLYHAFDTPNRMPKTRWNLHKKGKGERLVADSRVLVAEVGSLSMEFTRLSQITKDPRWYDAVARVTQVFEREQDRTRIPGMWPVVVNARKRIFTEDNAFTLGAMADSTYEYLAKTHILLGGVEPVYKSMYEKAMAAAIKHTIYRPMTPDNADMLMTGFVRAEGSEPHLDSQLQHLACFAGGMFALGGKVFNKPEHLTIGRKITDTCFWAYRNSPAGVMPEISHLYKCPTVTDDCPWDEEAWKENIASRASLSGEEKDPSQNIANLRLPKGFTSIEDRRYILRPEAIESVFVLYRTTGQQQWQAAAWDMFTAIEKHTATEFGNAALLDVSTDSPPRVDSMEVIPIPIRITTTIPIQTYSPFFVIPNSRPVADVPQTELLDGRNLKILLSHFQRTQRH
jgi:mannosyl-oligosaccharide alpha-1,2-mannosidase